MTDDSDNKNGDGTAGEVAAIPFQEFKVLMERFPDAIFSWTKTYPHLSASLILLSLRALGKITAETTKFREAEKKNSYEDIPFASFAAVKSAKQTLDETSQVARRLPRVALIALVTEYDLLISDLYRALIKYRPEVLKSAKKALSYDELFDDSNIENMRRIAIEHEIDEFSRKKRMEQIDKLGELTKLTPRKYLHEVGEFVEAIERRHLFVHTNGIVNKEYIETCSAAGAKIDCEPGAILTIDRKYLDQAASAIFVTGVVLIFLVWQKVAEKSPGPEGADALNQIGYELIDRKQYDVAIRILRFGCRDIKSHVSEHTRKMMVINLCNALRLSGKKDLALKEVESEDWSASSAEFLLAVHVVKEDYPEAAKLMQQIGAANKSMPRSAYHAWPLFRGFRETEDFRNAYEKIFGEPYKEETSKDEFEKAMDVHLEEVKEAIGVIAKQNTSVEPTADAELIEEVAETVAEAQPDPIAE